MKTARRSEPFVPLLRLPSLAGILRLLPGLLIGILTLLPGFSIWILTLLSTVIWRVGNRYLQYCRAARVKLATSVATS